MLRKMIIIIRVCHYITVPVTSARQDMNLFQISDKLVQELKTFKSTLQFERAQ